MNEKKDTVRKFWEGLDNGDLDSQLALLADDAVFTVTGATGVSGVQRGVEGVRAHMEHFGSHIEPGPRMSVVELIEEGDAVVCL